MIEETKSTRQRVLDTLLTQQHCTINELAEAVGINPISVRHHINRLEAEGLVTSTEQRYGVGRPRRLYSLTEIGREQYPTRYLWLTLKILDQLKENVPQQVIDEMFSQIALDLVTEFPDNMASLPVEKRLDLLIEKLSEEGFQLDWERKGDQFIIHEASCPYLHIVETHPEVCIVDQTLISTVLSLPIEKVECIVQGDAQCTFVIPNVISEEKEKDE
jgi:predicted ArsR family transcriptional regulator